VTFLLQRPHHAPYLLIRTVQHDQPWVSMRGAHELCISRHDESVINITRWSTRDKCKKLWASLVFTALEGQQRVLGCFLSCANPGLELVLFYYTFVSLKARSLLLVDIHPREFILRKETKHFQAYGLFLFFLSFFFPLFLLCFSHESNKGLFDHAKSRV
jgi:hypothetical protein